MPKNIISYGMINKRLLAKNSISKSNNNDYNSIEKEYRVINSKLENATIGALNIIKINGNKMLEALADSNSANQFKLYPLSIIENISKFTTDQAYIEYANQIANRYCSTILPYVSDIVTVAEATQEYRLPDSIKEKILKEANNYICCDRIINNHNAISKRFNLEDTIIKNRANLNIATEAVCNMIDTYNREPFQKMNICIEEMFYILEKYNINHKKTDIINSIIEYFLLSSPDLSDRNYNGFKKCINESCFISEEDMNNIKYVFNKRDYDPSESSSIRKEIENYYISSEKTKESLEETLDKCLASDIMDLEYNFKEVLEFIFSIYKAENLISDSDLEIVMDSIESKISNKIINLINNAELSKEQLHKMLICFIDKIEFIKSAAVSVPRCYLLLKHIKTIVTNVYPYIDFLYDDNNIKIITQLENCNIEIPISEGNIFRGHNLLSAIRNLDKYLGNKCKEFGNKIFGRNNAAKGKEPSLRDKISNFLFTDDDKWLSKKIKKGIKNYQDIADILTNSASMIDTSKFNPYSYITEESRMFDITLCSAECSEEAEPYVHSLLGEVCKDFNYILEADHDLENFKLYYLINANEVSLHLAENHKFILDEDSINKINEAYHPEYDRCLTKLAEANAICDFFNTINNKDIESSLFSYFSDDKAMSMYKFETILEGLSLLEVDKSVVEKFGNKYSDYLYLNESDDSKLDEDNNIITKLITEYNPEEYIPNEVKIESYLMIDALLESSEDDEEDDEEDDTKDENKEEDDGKLTPEEKEEVKKNPYKGINLNGIKMAIMGLKKRFSKMSQKEKELSRNLDYNFKHLVDSFKNALISDSRESVIKGSVVPSFSKCLKIGVPLAVGLGAGVVNPGVAAIAALGSFALSKHLTKKERFILLDEIETELEVVDKQIQMAERDEDMKKYRALLQYKKNLQRQYQRIRYNIKLGKNLLPGSNAGISRDHNNGY